MTDIEYVSSLLDRIEELEDELSAWRGHFVRPAIPRNVLAILTDICASHGISLDELRCERKSKHLVDARRDAVKKLYAETRMTYTAIGRLMFRDHASIINLVRPKKQRDKRVKGPSQ